MEKRIFLAIAISIGFLVLWGFIAPILFPDLVKRPQRQTETATATAPAASPATTTAAAPQPAQTEAPAVPETAAPAERVSAQRVQFTTVRTHQYEAVLMNRGAQLVSFKLFEYRQKDTVAPVDLVRARAADRTDFPFSIAAADAALADRLNRALYAVSERDEGGVRIVEYRYSDGRVSATKTFRFPPQPFLFDFSVSVSPAVPYRVWVGPGIRSLTRDEIATQGVTSGNGVVQQAGEFELIPRDKGDRVEVFPGIDYVGIEDNYFLSVLRPSRGAEGLLARRAFFDPETKERRDELYAGVNAMDGVVAGEAFFGPKETQLLDRYNFSEALQFGWFDIIARFLLSALVWINKFTQNYGFAIIVLTIIIKIALYPLQHKQNVSMKKMQRAQPKIEAIKAKYKKARGDAEQRQKMNVEMMQLYQKEGINPMAGCLPLLLQLPILWGFYNLLSRAIELRGAPFILWINDLSEKDPYYITPILMTATMFLQTWMMPATGDPMQRKIFLIMPLVFGFFFKDFPSGLVLYWLVQNVLTILQLWITNKWWKEHPAELQNA